MTGRFSIPSLDRLLDLDVNLLGVIVPSVLPHATRTPEQVVQPPPCPTDLPVADPYLKPNIIHLAQANHIPVWAVGSLAAPQTLSFLVDLDPDLIVVACFPQLFPAPLLALPQYGCLNLHPSLLPRYRGPAPLFWIAREDERTTGVTLHVMSDKVDGGDIVAQTHLDRPDGVSEAELEQQCAIRGADLLADKVQQLLHGQPLSRHPQNETDASYYPWPSACDFEVPLGWPARRAFNFMSGAEAWPLFVSIDNVDFYLQEAFSYSQEQTLGQSHRLIGDELWLQFQPGVVRAKVRHQAQSSN